MTHRARELDNRKQGDRGACPLCSPRTNRLREDQVWGTCPTNALHPAHEVIGTMGGVPVTVCPNVDSSGVHRP